MSAFRRSLSSLIALILSTNLALAEPVAQVIRLTGNAELVRGNAKGPITLGTALEPGDLVKTDATGRVRLHFIDGSTVNLGSQSDLLVAAFASQGPGTERQAELALGQGALRADAAPATPKSRLEIRTPLAVTAVRGTEWGILSAALQSDIIIFSGRVGVRRNIVSGESAISLTRTHGITVTAAGLGPIGRWSAEQLAAFDAATAVPGTDIPFNLGAAHQPSLTPIILQRESLPAKPNRNSSRCQDRTTSDCQRDSRDGGNKGGGGKDGGKESGGKEGGKEGGGKEGGGKEGGGGGGNGGGGNNGGGSQR